MIWRGALGVVCLGVSLACAGYVLSACYGACLNVVRDVGHAWRSP